MTERTLPLEIERYSPIARATLRVSRASGVEAMFPSDANTQATTVVKIMSERATTC